MTGLSISFRLRTAAFALLVLVTLAQPHLPGRFTISGADLLAAQAADGLPTGPPWTASPGIAPLGSDEVGVRLTGRGSEVFTVLGRHLRGASGHSHLLIRAELRGGALTASSDAWPPAGIGINSYTSGGQRLWYWPTRVATLEADDANDSPGWRPVEAVMPLNSAAEKLWLFVYVLSETGYMDARILAVLPVTEARYAVSLRWALFVAWLVVALLSLAWLTRVAGRRPLRLAAVALAALLTGGALTPQPYFSYFVDWSEALARPLVTQTWQAGHRLARTLRQAIPAAWTGSAADRGNADADGGPGTPTATPGVERRADAGGSQPQGAEQDTAAARTEIPVPLPAIGLREGTGHLLAFALLAFLSGCAWPRHRWPASVGCAAALSIAIQSVQGMLITRDADVRDLAFDMAGIALGTMAAVLVWGVAMAVLRRWRAPSAG